MLDDQNKKNIWYYEHSRFVQAKSWNLYDLYSSFPCHSISLLSQAYYGDVQKLSPSLMCVILQHSLYSTVSKPPAWACLMLPLPIAVRCRKQHFGTCLCHFISFCPGSLNFYNNIDFSIFFKKFFCLAVLWRIFWVSWW